MESSPAERAEVGSETKIFTEVVTSRLFSENGYLAHCEGSHDCVVVDPGLDVEPILEKLTAGRLMPRAILLTHGHADHIAGVEPLVRCFPGCPVLIGVGDADKLTDATLNLSANYGFGFTVPPADQLVRGGELLHFAGMEFEVRDTPGHSAGHVVFVCRQGDPWIVFGGDVLFREGVGRTDFPDGDSAALVRSIHEQLFTLPPNTRVLPGHGPETTIGHEQIANPFVGSNAPRRRFHIA